MKYWFRNIALLLLLLLGLLFLAAFWLLRTESGARLVLTGVSRFSTLQLEAEQIDGRLADELELRSFTIRWRGGEAFVERARLHWRPRALLNGLLEIRELELFGVDVRLAEGAAEREPVPLPEQFALPKLSGAALRFDAEIAALRVQDLTVRRPEQEAQQVDRLAGQLRWRNGVLLFDDLLVEAPQGHLAGAGVIDFVGPALRLSLDASSDSTQGKRQGALRVDLVPAEGERRLRGPVTITAQIGQQHSLQGEAQVDWSPGRLRIDAFQLSRPGQAGQVVGQGEAVLADGVLRWQAQLQIEQIDLADFGRPTDLSGAIAVQGEAGVFSGELRLANRLSGWQHVELVSPFTGSVAGMSLQNLEAKWLRGLVTGDLHLGWAEGFVVETNLQAARLDPAVLSPGWSGRINAELRGNLRHRQGMPLQAELQVHLPDSTLRGQRLTGDIDAALRGEDLQVNRLELHGDGFAISAAGQLREGLGFTADVRRLDGLLPGGHGSFRAQGVLRYTAQMLSGEVTAEGRDLHMPGIMDIEKFSLKARHRQGGALHLSATARDLRVRQWHLIAADLLVDGQLGDHTGEATFFWPSGELEVRARGAWAAGFWRGEVTRLAGREAGVGNWRLQEPVALSLSGERIVVGSATIVSGRGEQLRLRADLAWDPWAGEVQAEWQNLNLEHADPWLSGEYQLFGRSSGTLLMRLRQGDLVLLEAKTDTTAHVEYYDRSLHIEQGLVEVIWHRRGLQGKWQLDLGADGSTAGQVDSPQPAAFRVPETGRVQGTWRDFELALLAPWLPQVQVEGRSSGDLQLDWRQRRLQRLQAQTTFAAWVQHQQLAVRIAQGKSTVQWDEQGLAARWDLRLDGDGQFAGSFSSPQQVFSGLPEAGAVEAEWHGLDLSLLGPLWPELQPTGTASGDLRGAWSQQQQLKLEAHLTLAGEITYQQWPLRVQQAEAQLHWGGEGLAGAWQVQLEDGSIRGEVHSEVPGRLQLPEQGRFAVSWRDLPLKPLQPLLPEGIFLEGELLGSMEGDWSPAGNFQLHGRSEVAEGMLRWQRTGGIVSAPLRSVELAWDWAGDALRGTALVALQEHGKLDVQFQLPLTARFPLQLPPEGPLQASLTADLREEGLLTAFFPGLVQETRGRVEADLQVGGSWAQPQLAGRLRLSEAGAYLPAAGIHLRGLLLEMQLAGEEIQIETLQVQSGPGQLQGEGLLRLRNGQLESYRGTLRGERFQTVNLPELRILATPDLQFEGTRQRLAVRGEVLLPELLVFGRDTSPPVEVSRDVVIVDAPEVTRGLPMALDLQVRVILGDRVLVKTQGIDARLEGSVLVRARGLDQITGQGEITVAQGTYAALGLKLRIDRGVLLFAGGPIDQPTLDILAVRPIGEVRAGVQVTGTPRQPLVVLYSDPAMPDTDILAYIVLGAPLGEGGEQVGLLMLAAGTLLSKGESVVLQDRLRRRLGVDVLVIDSGEGDVAESRITVGKYLSPELYISFGQSLFTNIQEVRLRYSITDKWQLESAVGVESSIDLYYQIEFR